VDLITRPWLYQAWLDSVSVTENVPSSDWMLKEKKIESH